MINKEKDLKIKQLETEVESLKHDWLMCDEVCDQKQFKIRELSEKEKKYQKIFVDLEAIIAWQNSYIFTLDNTIEAQNFRMYWYNDFINEYDGQLLEIGKVLDKSEKKDIAKKIKKIKGKIRQLLPKENRRYGRNKTK